MPHPNLLLSCLRISSTQDIYIGVQVKEDVSFSFLRMRDTGFLDLTAFLGCVRPDLG